MGVSESSQSNNSSTWSRSKKFPKGTRISTSGIARMQFGADTVSFTSVSPTYLDCELAVHCSQSMVHTAVVFGAHACQIDVSWANHQWRRLTSHMVKGGILLEVSDTYDQIKEDLSKVCDGETKIIWAGRP